MATQHQRETVKATKQEYAAALVRHQNIVTAIADDPYLPRPQTIQAFAQSAQAVVNAYAAMMTAASVGL